MQRKIPDRVPVMPQVCHGHAINIFYEDYRKGIVETVRYPEKALNLVLKAAIFYGFDGLRLFAPGYGMVPGYGMDVIDNEREMIVKWKNDSKVQNSKERAGIVDVYGGGHIIYDEPILRVNTKEDLKKIPRIKCSDLIETKPFKKLKEAIGKAHDNDLFVASAPGGFTMNYVSDLRGQTQALFDIKDNTNLVNEIMDIGLEISIERAKALIKCGVDAFCIGDALASASVISPSSFKNYCFPRFKIFCNEFKKENILIYMHICGNAVPLFEMMASTGVDCIEPLDPLGGVKVSDAKKQVGKEVALMGGVNTITLLSGNPGLVYDEGISCCKAGGNDGGYILAAGDMVPDFAPKNNIKALVRAAKDYKY